MLALRVILLQLITLLCVPVSLAEKIDLKVGLIRAGGQQYFVDLLQQSMEVMGHDVSIDILEDLPQARTVYMVQNGDLSLTWLIQTDERDHEMVPIEVGITNGLIGHRVLLIPPTEQHVYDEVYSLDDFRELNKVGVLGKNWYDVKVWKFNDLPYIEREGGWQAKVYRQIASGRRGLDYFSRGVFEVVEEADQHPYLMIENNLLLIYDRDFRFYLSKKAEKYKAIVLESVLAARESGLMDRLIRKHWASAFERLSLDHRRQILLKNPPENFN
ncbi:hypothetical protein [Hahella ganghwensis]|uniref:hypothetical protein n=1 Tax=Hahella ganghwensis TaxID=286420 RepID=UPI00036A17CF|nr:hypothetical protein [Hahella ganghwensis]